VEGKWLIDAPANNTARDERQLMRAGRDTDVRGGFPTLRFKNEGEVELQPQADVSTVQK
jgi:hypothetical protein